MLCLSRRRCTEEGIRIASRYFATVRRAISMPDSRNRSTIVSSERIAAGASLLTNFLIGWRAGPAQRVAPPSRDGDQARVAILVYVLATIVGPDVSADLPPAV